MEAVLQLSLPLPAKFTAGANYDSIYEIPVKGEKTGEGQRQKGKMRKEGKRYLDLQ